MRPDRLLSAVVVWTQERVMQQENGAQKWRELLAVIDSPPAGRAGPVPASVPASVGVLRMTPEQERAGFAAFSSMT